MLVGRKIGSSETSALISHTNRCELKHKQELLADYGITGSSGPVTTEDVREYCTLWVAESARPFTIINDRYVS
jgi:hypothetical protein